MSCSKITVHDVPSNRKCQRTLHRIVFGTEACPFCGTALKYTDPYAWCGKCRKKVRVKAVCWLRSSKLSYRQIFTLILAWQSRCTPGDIVTLVGLSYPTIELWFRKFRDHLPRDTDPLKGLVEVDESFFGKRKHHHQTIVAGAKERKGRAKLRIIPDREEGTLETWLLESVNTASKVFSDLWKGYQNIEWYGYAHEPHNHSLKDFAGTTHAENLWSVAKRQIQKQYGRFHRPYLEGLLKEWEARHNFPELFTQPETYLRECLFRFV